MKISKIDKSEMSSRGGFGRAKTWDHELIQDTLKEAYESNAEEDGEEVVVEFSEEEAYNEFILTDESYKDWVNSRNHPHPTMKTQIKKNLEKAGFMKESTEEGRKSPVGGQTTDDGYIIQVELNPLE